MNKPTIHTDITNEERDLFRTMMSDVKPLQPSTCDISESKQKSKATVKKKQHLDKAVSFQKSETHLVTALEWTRTPEPIAGEATITFQRTGLQRKLLIQFRQGKLPIHATLDLHKHTRDQAITATDHFLLHCQQHNYRFVRIIHGKGHCSSPEAPVIKNLLNHYLRSHPAVLAFHSSKPKHGGAGALYVIVKGGI